MAVLSIIGLGKIGASAGLALASHAEKISRLGHDIDPTIARKAQALGAVEKVHFNLPAAVEKADIVLLALPFDQIHDTMKVIAPCLREGAVVLDTSTVKQAVATWMKDLLPPKRYYVGLLPAINPGYLENHPAGVEGAREDLFRHGLMAVAAPQGTASEAVKLGADLAALMGATPFFIDLAEVDGMMAALHLLPQVSAAALAGMMISRPGWNDARKLTGSPFSNATLPALAEEKGEALTEALIGNQANMLAVLDELVAELARVRAFLAEGDREALGRWMETARQGRIRW